MELWNIKNTLSAAETLANEAAETVSDAGGLSELIDNFDPMRFITNSTYMGVGMLGIFIVMGTLIIGTALLNKILNRKPKEPKQ